jgi:serine/threonine protein kinase
MAAAAGGNFLARRATALNLLQACGQLHTKGFVHCDIKANNVLLLDDRSGVVLTDFNLAQDMKNILGGTVIALSMTPSRQLYAHAQRLTTGVRKHPGCRPVDRCVCGV